MSTLINRSLVALAACGVTATLVLAQSSTPPVPTKDHMKDAAKEAGDHAKKAAEDLKKQAQDAAKKAAGGHDHGGAGGAPDEKMMEEMMAAMQPGPMHAWLKKWEGNWNLVVKSFPSPGAEPMVMKMTSKSAMSMNGRFLIEDVTGEIEMPGVGKLPFEGQSVVGYDNMQKKFFSTWRDNMSTGMMIEFGTVDAAGKVLTCEGENWNMHLGAMSKSKSVLTVIDDNTRKYEMWAPGHDGQMTKVMEIDYTRK